MSGQVVIKHTVFYIISTLTYVTPGTVQNKNQLFEDPVNVIQSHNSQDIVLFSLFSWLIPDDPPPRRNTFTPQRITISSDTDSSTPSPKPNHPSSIQQRPSLQKANYLNIPPHTTITLVHQRHPPPKPRGLHIPFWGRRRNRTKKISLDRLWEVHYRLERLRKAGLPTNLLKSSETTGRGRGRPRGRPRGSGRGRGAGRGDSSSYVGGRESIVGIGDVNNSKVSNVGRMGRSSYEQLLVNGVMGQQRSRSPEL